MKKFLILPIAALLIAACGICKPTPPNPSENTVVHVIDSVAWHDSTVYYVVPKEIYNDYTSLLDTLKLATSFSEFESWVDTTSNTLKGTARNTVEKIPVEIKWKEKIVYKDSVSIKEIPVPYEVEKVVTKYPTSYWWFMGFTILALIYLGIKLYLKFKRV